MYYFLAFGCMGSGVASEEASQQGVSVYILGIYILVIALAVAIPLFVTGIVKANNRKRLLKQSGLNAEAIDRPKKMMSLAFALSIAIPIVTTIIISGTDYAAIWMLIGILLTAGAIIFLGVERGKISKIMPPQTGDIIETRMESAILSNVDISQKGNIVSGVGTNSKADEIAKMKSLLDAGAITKEEYEKAKQDILNG